MTVAEQNARCQADDCVDTGGVELNCSAPAYFRITTSAGGNVVCEEHLLPAVSTVIGAHHPVTVSLE